MRTVLIALFAIAGCGQNSGDGCPNCIPGDSGASLDSARSDGSSPLDASSTSSMLCVGSALGGTCVESFFDAVFACFAPTGACTSDQSTNPYTFCWPDGNKIAPANGGKTWTNGTTECVNQQYVATGSHVGTYTFQRGGQTLVYESGTGKVTCPDGSSLQISGGPDKFFSECPKIGSQLLPITSCTGGSCP
jgi:hypothetical protein